MDEFHLRTEDLVSNPTPRVAVGLCLDVSGSMTGEPIEELNKGVAHFYEAVSGHEIARHAAEVAVVSFAGIAINVRNFGPVLGAEPPTLSVDMQYGGTSIGSGVKMSLDLLEERKSQYRETGVEYYQPWLVVLTDGQPTDETHLQVAPRIVQVVNAGRLSVFPIGVGPYADLGALEILSPKRKPLRLKGLNFTELFEWLSQSVARVSESRPGDQVPLDAEGRKEWAEI